MFKKFAIFIITLLTVFLLGRQVLAQDIVAKAGGGVEMIGPDFVVDLSSCIPDSYVPVPHCMWSVISRPTRRSVVHTQMQTAFLSLCQGSTPVH